MVFDVETRGLSARPESFIFGCVVGHKVRKTFFNVHDFKEFIFSRKNRGKVFFAHNAEYDLTTLFGNIIKELDNKAIFSGGLFIKAKKKNVTFLNSLAILKSSVKELGKNLGLDKMELDNKFKDGVGPISVTQEDVNYCFRDCDIIFEYLKKIYSYSGEIKPTVASVAMNIFTKKYLKRHIHIHPLNENFRESYYGGRVECFRMGSVRANKFDVNSLYPFICTQIKFPDFENLFEKGSVPVKVFLHYLTNYEGQATVTVKHKKSFVGCLPFRMKDELIYPTGVFSGTWNFNELRTAVNTGLVEIVKVKKFIYGRPKQFSELKKYMLDFFHLKNTTSGADKIIFKFLLNALTGKFAERQKNELIYFPDFETFVEQEKKFDGKNYEMKPFSKDREDFFIEVEKKISKTKKYLIPTVSSYICSGARSYMVPFYIEYRNQLVYTDTDSIVMNGNLSPSFVGEELGKFKKEKEIVTYIFGNKHYSTLQADGLKKLYLKGIPKDHKVKKDGSYIYNKMTRTKESLRRGIEPGLFFEVPKFLSKEYTKRTVRNNKTNPLNIKNK